MKRSTYLIIIGLVAFDYVPKGLFPFMTLNVTLIIILLMAIIGPFVCKSNNLKLNTFNNRKWVYLILALFGLSIIYPVITSDQTVINTLIALRHTLPIFFLFTLLKIAPGEDDLEKSLSFLGKFALVMGVIAIIFPEWFVDNEKLRDFRFDPGNDLTIIWPGFRMAVLYFYILIGKLWHSSKYKDLIWTSVFILYIIIVQNRSTLICAVPFFCLAYIKSNIKYKWVIFAIVFVSISGYILTILGDLIEETQRQLGDTSYNRWQAIQFFLLEQNDNLYTFLFGHGIPAKGSSYLDSLLSAQNMRLAFISDIGLLGTYYYYGIAMLIIIYRFVFIGIFNRKMPIYVRLYSLWLLFVPTIHLFGVGYAPDMLLFVLYFYMIDLYKSSSTNERRLNHNCQLQYA